MIQHQVFSVQLRGPSGITSRRCIEVAIDDGHAAYRLLHSWPLEVAHHGESITVSIGESMSYTIPPWRARPHPSRLGARCAGAHRIEDRELTS